MCSEDLNKMSNAILPVLMKVNPNDEDADIDEFRN